MALGGLVLAGCEDGPNQTFSPAPSGAANLWNNGGQDASTNDPATRDFDAGGGGTTLVNICTPAEQNAAWSKAFTAPIVPPFSMGGLDLSTGGTFSPFTIELAEHGGQFQGTSGPVDSPRLCQGESFGACGDGTGNPAYAWGPSTQFSTCYDIATHQLTFFYALPGYDGEVNFTLPAKDPITGAVVPFAKDQNGVAGDLHFTWHIGQPVKENGKDLNLGWSASGINPTVADKLYLGLMATFQPGLIQTTDKTTTPPLNELTDANHHCLVSATCRTSANPDGSGGNFGVRPVGVYFDAALSNSTNPATAASPSDMYMYPVKFVPYSLAPYNIGLDTFPACTATQTTNCTPNADPNLKYNGQPIYGPYSPAGPLLKSKTPCTLYMGSTFGDFIKNCIKVSGDTAQDNLNFAKLLGAQHHTAEWYSFSVVGVNQNFNADTAELTGANGLPSVLADTQGTLANPPHDDDPAADFEIDVRASGAVLNDMRGDSFPATKAVTALDTYEDVKLAGQDMHGTGTVVSLFRQLVLDDLRAQYLAMHPGATLPNPADCQKGRASAPAGCTGFETLLSPAMPLGIAGKTDWQDNVDLNPHGFRTAATLNAGVPVRSIFRPGDPELVFADDPINGAGYNKWITAPNLVQAALQEVVAVMGNGNPKALPSEARDWRYYFRWWAEAFGAYLLNRHLNPTWYDLYQTFPSCQSAPGVACTTTLRKLNPDDLFFDLVNGIDHFEYIDRDPAEQLGSPLDFEYDILLTTSNTQDMNMYQRLEREEKALYTSMLTDKTKVPGSNENVFVSDLFGAPAVVNYYVSNNLWGPGTTGKGTSADPEKLVDGKDTYYCVTQPPPGDPDCNHFTELRYGADLNFAPTTVFGDPTKPMLVDGKGRPLFTNYRGIFPAVTAASFAGGPTFTSPSSQTQWLIGGEIPITQTLPYIASAIVNIPNYANPYDLTSKNTSLSTLVPWYPYQPGNGFEIPINAQRSQFITTGALDFSGVTVTMNVDYLPKYDKTSGALTAGTIAAVETQDFLGEVFPCVDSVSGDILRVSMYDSSQSILDWLDAHPGTRASCNIFVRTSPYNNYPDYIVSLVNGVLLGVNPGAGGGGGASRIADVTLFNPALLTQTQ